VSHSTTPREAEQPSARDRELRFRAVYEAVHDDLLRFVRRRDPAHAEDVTAEAFLTAWRRFEELPGSPGDARAWLFGIARNVLLNERRGSSRRQALGVRLAQPSVATPGESDDDLGAVAVRLDLARAWTLLTETHQEVLALAVFDDLSAPEGAAVLGISPVAFRLRLSRARRTLRLHLEHPAPHPRPAHQTIDRSTR